MKVLAVDYGEKKIGLAISDELGIASVKLPVLQVKHERDKMEGIFFAIREFDPQLLLFGVPSSSSGGDSKQAIDIKNFIEEFKKELHDNSEQRGIVNPPNIQTWDESFSTQIAEKGKSRKFKKEKADSEAARIFLQEFLESNFYKKQCCKEN
ncbi:Holliday junction resolvase RuvX [Candidatus Dojkabacteria bacterium]|nr:Holliday junction resolvase RuvX [Candidatus Dojkabacteria bacterium]